MYSYKVRESLRYNQDQQKVSPTWRQLRKTGERTATQNMKTVKQKSQDMKNQGNITLPNDHNNPLVTVKYMESCDLPDEEFKIAALRKLKKWQENTKR